MSSPKSLSLHTDTGDLVVGLHLPQLRYHLGAFGHSDGAKRMEDAPRRRVQRAGHLAAQHNTLSARLHLRVPNRHRRQQSLGVGVQGAFVKPLAIGHFDDLAKVHHCHPVRDMADHGEIMSNE